MANIPPPNKEKKKAAVNNVKKPTGATEQSPPDAIKPLQLKIPERHKE